MNYRNFTINFDAGSKREASFNRRYVVKGGVIIKNKAATVLQSKHAMRLFTENESSTYFGLVTLVIRMGGGLHAFDIDAFVNFVCSCLCEGKVIHSSSQIDAILIQKNVGVGDVIHVCFLECEFSEFKYPKEFDSCERLGEQKVVSSCNLYRPQTGGVDAFYRTYPRDPLVCFDRKLNRVWLNLFKGITIHLENCIKGTIDDWCRDDETIQHLLVSRSKLTVGVEILGL